MAIFTSDQLANGGLPVKSNNSGSTSITTKIVIPAGTALALNDELKFCRVAGNVVLKDAVIKTSELDSGTDTVAGTIGHLRATVDPSKAFNATTNPYITGAASAASAASLAAAATIQGVMRTGGVAAADLAALPDGIADVALTITAAPNVNPNTDRTIEITFDIVGESTIPGEFAGGNAYNYTNETA